MKAVIQTGYGSPDVLQLKDIDKPTPQDNELLIKVRASSVTIVDSTFRKGDPFVSRLFIGLTKPKNKIPGGDFVGVVEATGKDVTSYAVGDVVYGATHEGFGAHMEYICLPEDAAIEKKPAQLSDEDAAAILYGALTALPFVRDEGKVGPGQKVLINGASGGVGVYAVQFARYYGAEVTAVCSAKNAAMVKQLGAHRVIDYKEVDFTQEDQSYDVVFDVAGKSSFSRSKRVLKPNGIYLTPVMSGGILLRMMWTSMFGKKKARIAFTGLRDASDKKKDLAFFNELIEAGQLNAVVDRKYPFEQIAEAHRYVDSGQKFGNVVIEFGV